MTFSRSIVQRLAGLLLLVSVSSYAEAARRPVPSPWQGKPLTSALRELQSRGLVIVYSSTVVLPAMRVISEPEAIEPRKILDEILRPHGLEARESSGHLIILPASPDSTTGIVRGNVRTLGPIASDVTIRLPGTNLQTVASPQGEFLLSAVPPGEYKLEAEAQGYVSQQTERFHVHPGEVREFRLELVPMTVFLEEVVVSPSHFRLLDEDPVSRQFLSRDEVERMPHLADDLYWAAKRLPGATGADLSALFGVRGGDPDEILVLLDGMELYEPFHLKDFLSLFSIIDSSAVGGVDLLTGGFPVEYGGRMSGVMDISTHFPESGRASSVSLSTMEASFLTSGTLDDARTQWLVAARAWYPDDVLRLTEIMTSPLVTDYYDALGRFTRRIDERSTLSLGILTAYDDLNYQVSEPDDAGTVDAGYLTSQLWLNLQSEWSGSLSSRTVLSAANLSRERNGGAILDDLRSVQVDDERWFQSLGLKQDWLFDVADRHLLKWGFDLKGQRASYRYTRRILTDAAIGNIRQSEPQIDIETEPRGESYGAYVADRFRIGPSLVAELGIRWDKEFWIDDHQVSPRLNLVYTAGSGTVVRGAWGRFQQWQQVNELQIEDGLSDFHPAQSAEQWLLGIERRISNGLAARVEAYYKELRTPRPRYENLFDSLELFPEAEPDRVRVAPDRGQASGIEILLKNDFGKHFTWWTAYTLSESVDEIEGESVPRSWDQRHAVSFGLHRRFRGEWDLSLGGNYHSGWPTTSVAAMMSNESRPRIELITGPRNAERLPIYYRIDGRLSKSFNPRVGPLTLTAEILNLTGRENVCCINFETVSAPEGNVRVRSKERYWPRILPSLSLRWQF